MVQPSPNQRDSIQVKNEDGQVVGKERRYLYAGGKREVFDEACKAIEKGDLELVLHEGDENGIGREVLESIGRTTFERLLPKNLGQMSDAHKEQMVCGICQDAQWAFEARNRSLLTRLEYYDKLLTEFPQGHPVHQKIRRDKKKFVNEALKKDEDGEWVPKFDTLNEFYLSMCCKSVSENDWEVPYECLLGKCDECPEMERYFGEHVESVTEGPNVVKWKQNRVSYFCPNHGFIAYNSGKCPKCEQANIPQKDRPPPRKEQEIGWDCLPIKKFLDGPLTKSMRKFMRHRCLYKRLEQCIKDREELLSEHPGNVLIRRDYSAKFPMVFNRMSMGPGMNPKQVGMEGMTTKFEATDSGDTEMHWIGWISDEKEQSARTSYENSRKTILKLKAMGKLTAGGTLYFISDGCGKQYRSANAFQTMIWLAMEFDLKVDWSYSAAQHGKNSTDAFAGADKNRVGVILRTNKVDNATRNPDGSPISCGGMCYEILSHPTWRYPLEGDTKHKRKEGQIGIKERHYGLTNFDEDNPIPFDGVTFFIDDSQWGSSSETKNKINEMFHLYCHPFMPMNTLAARRIPCVCEACTDQLNKKWIAGVPLKDQPRFAIRNDCAIERQMRGMNKWNFVQVEIKDPTNSDRQKVNRVLGKIMETHVEDQRRYVNNGWFGAIATEDEDAECGMWLVEWKSEPYALDQDSILEGFGNTEAPKGTIVAKGVYYNRIKYAPGWYEKDRNHKLFEFSLQHVIASFQPEKYDEEEGMVPPPQAKEGYNRRSAKQFVKFVTKENRELIGLLRIKLDNLTPYDLDKDEKKERPVKEPKANERTLCEGFVNLDDEDEE